MFAQHYELIGKIALNLLFIYFLYKLLKGLYTCFLGHALRRGVKWKPSPNTWAVITGGIHLKNSRYICLQFDFLSISLATDGIGLEYANQFAKIGYSLLIISRNDEKLQKTRSEILSKYPKCSYVKTLAVDFTKSDIYDTIKSEIDRLEVIDVLVNNVGMSFVVGEYLTHIPNSEQFITSLINVNIVAMTKMIDLILPKMVHRSRGIITNVSSISGAYPTPLISAYSASKAYEDFLSRALHDEYKNEGIVIQSVLPAFVSTKMSNLSPSFFIPTPKQYVSEALKTVGIESRTYGYWTHKMMGFFQDCIISNIIGSYYNSINGYNKLKYYRDRYYKKRGLIDPMK